MWERECAACGKPFTAKHKARVYCDECKEHGNPFYLKKSYDMASIRNHKYDDYKPYIYKLNCEECGKDIGGSRVVIDKYLYRVNDGRHYFCTQDCYTKYLSKHRYCYQCNKHLEKPTILGWHNDMCFCSDECKFEYAKDRKLLRTCEYCGKHFVRKKGWFCSQECSRAAKKNGWVKPKPSFEDDWF